MIEFAFGAAVVEFLYGEGMYKKRIILDIGNFTQAHKGPSSTCSCCPTWA